MHWNHAVGVGVGVAMRLWPWDFKLPDHHIYKPIWPSKMILWDTFYILVHIIHARSGKDEPSDFSQHTMLPAKDLRPGWWVWVSGNEIRENSSSAVVTPFRVASIEEEIHKGKLLPKRRSTEDGSHIVHAFFEL